MENDGIASAGYDPKRTSRGVRIMASHQTRDMSVAGGYSRGFFFDLEDPKNAEGLNLGGEDGGVVKVILVSDDVVVLKWGNDEFRLTPGALVSTESVMVYNPYLSYDAVSLTFSWCDVPNYKDLVNRIIAVGYRDSESGSFNEAISKEKEEIKTCIDGAIGRGNVGLWVAKALLESSASWRTCKITSPGHFSSVLQKGVEVGCLAPADRIGWDWMKIAMKYNDPATFMEDKKAYKVLLTRAADNGVVLAKDILEECIIDN